MKKILFSPSAILLFVIYHLILLSSPSATGQYWGGRIRMQPDSICTYILPDGTYSYSFRNGEEEYKNKYYTIRVSVFIPDSTMPSTLKEKAQFIFQKIYNTTTTDEVRIAQTICGDTFVYITGPKGEVYNGYGQMGVYKKGDVYAYIGLSLYGNHSSLNRMFYTFSWDFITFNSSDNTWNMVIPPNYIVKNENGSTLELEAKYDNQSVQIEISEIQPDDPVMKVYRNRSYVPAENSQTITFLKKRLPGKQLVYHETWMENLGYVHANYYGEYWDKEAGKIQRQYYFVVQYTGILYRILVNVDQPAIYNTLKELKKNHFKPFSRSSSYGGLFENYMDIWLHYSMGNITGVKK